MIVAWIAVIAWMGFIYSMSADNAEQSSEKSNTVVDFVAEAVVPDYEAMTPEEKSDVRSSLSLPIRKLAHVTEYAVLGILAAVAVWLTPKLEKAVFRIACPFVLSIAYASLDEFHQSKVPGRGPAFTDVCIDALGAALGIALVWGIYILFCLRRAKKVSE